MEEEDDRPCAALLLLAIFVWSLLEKHVSGLDLLSPMKVP